MTVPLEVVAACVVSAAVPALRCRTWFGVGLSVGFGVGAGLLLWGLFLA